MVYTPAQFDVGALLKGSAAIQQSLGGVRERELEDTKLAREAKRFAREQELNARADTEYNREVSGRKALQDYASKPLDISTMLGTQTKTADEALIADANRRNELFAKSLADNKITQEDIDKGRVSPELLGKLYNPALDVNASTGIQKTYESVTPFREDVESRIEKDLIAQNVDPLKAKQYAQMEGQKYQSIPEYQAMLTAQAEKMTNNSKEQFKDNLELTKFNREVYKDELDKYKIKMDNLTKVMGSTGSGGTGGGGLLSQDKSKAYDEVYSKAGNSNELASKLDAAFQVYGAKAVNNALAASGINEPVRLLEWDVGKRDASLERFDNALKNEKPLSEVQGQFGNGAPNAPAYSLPTPATVYTADSARSAAQDRVKNSVLGYLGDSTSKASSTLLSEAAKETTEKKTNNDFTDTVKSIETSKAGGDYSKVNKIGAMGAYQFTPDTLDYINKVTGKNVTKEEFLKNPAIQDEYFKELTNANKTVLIKTGIAPTDFNAWAAHNLGVGNVRNLLDTSTPAKDNLKSFIKSNLPEGQEPTKENYIKYYAPKFGVKYEDVVNKDNIKANPIEVANHKRLLDPKSVKDIDWSHPDSVLPADTVDSILSFNKDGNPTDNRLAEINSQLGANPAPTPENLALMDERSKLAPRSIGSKTMDYVDTLRRELIDPLGASGYVVGGIPKVGSMLPKIGGGLNNGFGKLSELLTPSTKPMVIEEVPKLLENLRPQGTPNWSGTGRVATDKLNGINADAVLGQSGNQGSRLLGALENAKEAKGLLDEVKPTNLATPNYFSNIKNELDMASKVKNETEARTFWNGVVDAKAKGQLSDEQVVATMRKLSDSGLISTRELLEALDKVGFKR